MKIAKPILIMLLTVSTMGMANNVQIANVSLNGQNGYTMIKFDTNWDNSWCVDTAPDNWDASWVFVKYRLINEDTWNHTTLYGQGGTEGHVAPAGAVVYSSDDTESEESYGVFIHRDVNNAAIGNVNFSNVALRWNYTDDGLADDDGVEVCVFAYACVGSLGNEVPLPIELIDFSAVVRDNVVVLKWETASTLNNDYFTVERSPDGHNFEVVENIQGVGTSSRLLAYTTIDRHPYEEISYYRLKQTDFNGKYTYSHIEAVNFGDTRIPGIVVYPNPTHNRIAIIGNKIKVEELEIFNTLGQDMSPFVNIDNYDRQNIVIDMSPLPSSIYLIKVSETTFSIYKE